MDNQGFESFCGSPLWDSNITWYTDRPNFTTCFQKTVLVWVPCLLLWLLMPVEFYYIKQSKNKNIPWTKLNVSKYVFTALLIVINITHLSFSLLNGISTEIIYPVDFYTPSVRISTFALSIVLLRYNLKKGLHTSGILFTFWFLLSVCESVQFVSLIIEASKLELSVPFFTFILHLIYYILVVILCLLNCFAEASPEFQYYSPTENPSPEEKSSFLSNLFYIWIERLVWKGFKRPLQETDIWSLNPNYTAKVLFPLFNKYWEQSFNKNLLKEKRNATYRISNASVNFGSTKNKPKPVASILPAIWKSFGLKFSILSCTEVILNFMMFLDPQILSYMIAFVENDDEETWKGYLYAVLLLLSVSLQTIISTQYVCQLALIGAKLRTALISSIYRKSLRLSNIAKREYTIGEIVNLMSSDAQRFGEFPNYVNLIWSAPLQIALALYFLWQILGPSVLAGFSITIILIIFSALLASKMKLLQAEQMKYQDQRIRLTNEVLSSIKVLKLYSWEPSFEKHILDIRKKETKVIKQAAYLNATSSFLWDCAPVLVSSVTFATYVLISEDNVLDSQKAFVSISLFNLLRDPISMLPMTISLLTQVIISLKRTNKFMNAEELDPSNVSHDKSGSKAVVIRNGKFAWSVEENDVLRNINFEVKYGQLVAIVGSVGSGKSSLMSAILGEMEKLNGFVNTKGSIAYVSQQAWIQNAQVRENITFGKKYNPWEYDRVVEACALKPDFEMLMSGDLTEIGEKGINLSGGQKQRISMARALYNNAEIYLLDDPLSAVDSHVGKHIFEKAIGPRGILRKKTRIMVTHGITFLPAMDLIVVLKNGEISEYGNYQELLQKKGTFSEFLINQLQNTNQEDDMSDGGLDEIKHHLEAILGTKELGRMISTQKSRFSDSSEFGSSIGHKSLSGSISESIGSKTVNRVGNSSLQVNLREDNNDIENGAEKLEVGSVKWDVYAHYIKSIGISSSLLTISLNLLFHGFAIASNFWLAAWSNDPTSNEVVTRNMYLGIYGAFGLAQTISVMLSTFSLYNSTIRAARTMHNQLLSHILKTPVSFFDVTPIGRILNRFSRDVNVMDLLLPTSLRGLLFCVFAVFATVFVISYSTPIFLTICIPITIIYCFMQRFYVATSRQLKRLESILRSPMYSHFSESITGGAVIRAYRVQEEFIAEHEEKLDKNQACTYINMVTHRWLAVRLEMMGSLIIFFASIFVILGRNTVSAGLVGLSVSYSLQITRVLNRLVRIASNVENNIVAIERIKEYSEIAQEAPRSIPSMDPSGQWPFMGRIEIKNLQLRYREGLELVLRGINCTIDAGEMVGIVGRTGAGKSSLTLALFRIIEAAGGSIIIDGKDIAKMGLHTLRAHLTIIPQEPILFSSTLRMNLDPDEKHSDAELWKALEHAHLSGFVQSLHAGLDSEVTEGGGNLSVGQRQLVCLARALLKKPKILVLDEATASVDLETDELIQKSVRSEFKGCTVLTIAHRLNTIMDSNRVMVLDKGQISEFDTPKNLLENVDSIFFGMAKDAGLV